MALQLLLIDACNVLKTAGFHGGSLIHNLKRLGGLVLSSKRFNDFIVELVVDNAQSKGGILRRIKNRNGRYFTIVSCGFSKGKLVDADSYICAAVQGNRDYSNITIVTNDKELEVRILNEVYQQPFDLEFVSVKSFFKKLGG